MDRSSYKVIGLMSGTSLDGLDLAYCHFEFEGGIWQFEIIETESIRYDSSWQQTLKSAFDLDKERLDELDISYGRWMGDATSKFINKYNLDVDLVASHGHTVFHQPEKGITIQIGSGQVIANITGKKVVCDFRKADVLLGGQGAPLVPIGDEYLFSKYITCVNLGGISNISFRLESKRVAFDIGMANMLLNYIINKIDKPFDESGNLARTGTVESHLLNQLNELEYHQLSFPKSTGYEWFLSDVKPLIDESKLSIADLLATSVEHEAIQLGLVLTDNLRAPGQVLVTGGGAMNTFLMERIKHHTPANLEIVIPDEEVIDFKEAMVFALMGVLRLRNEINCFSSVTGASKDVSGGEIFEPIV